jgi:hypothetical protein
VFRVPESAFFGYRQCCGSEYERILSFCRILIRIKTRIRIFFLVNADLDPDPAHKMNADPDPVETLPVLMFLISVNTSRVPVLFK